MPESLAYYADEARGCTAEAVPTGDDDDAKIHRAVGTRGGETPPPPFPKILADELALLDEGGRLCHHITACLRIFTPSYGPEEQIDNDQDVGLVAK